jgi:hypothetical protein
VGPTGGYKKTLVAVLNSQEVTTVQFSLQIEIGYESVISFFLMFFGIKSRNVRKLKIKNSVLVYWVSEYIITGPLEILPFLNVMILLIQKLYKYRIIGTYKSL